MSYSQTCMQCEGPFESRRPEAKTCSPECKTQRWIEQGLEAPQAPTVPVHEHALDEVRGDAEESKEKARWTLIAREHIAHTLLETGYFSAEDFDALGIPTQHVNVGNSQIGRFAKGKLMEKLSWRYSSKESRKGGIVWTFQITEKGRKELPALLADTRKELAGPSADVKHVDSPVSARSGDEVGVGKPQGAQGSSIHPIGTDDGSGDVVGGPSASPEPALSLLPDEPEKPARPLSPFRDAEAA